MELTDFHNDAINNSTRWQMSILTIIFTSEIIYPNPVKPIIHVHEPM